MAAPRLETRRLILRGWQDQDLAPFAAMCADAEVMRWIADGRTRTRSQSEATVAALVEDWHQRGFGLFALEHKGGGEFCGFCGLSPPGYLPALMPAVEVGWRLPRPFWGRGLATEAAERVLRFAFEDLSLERLLSIYQAGNLRSRRVMDRLGMRFWLAATDPSCQRRVRVCELTRDAWLHRQPSFHSVPASAEYFFGEGCYILELLNDPAQPEASIARARVPAGTTTRWHRLRGIIERYVILEGAGRAEIGAAQARDVGPGDVVSIPPMVPQRITSTGPGDLVFLAVCTPRFEPGRYLPD